MSSNTSTPAALSSEARRLSGKCWRAVEAQHRVSTMKLVNSTREQEILEALIEESKPALAEEHRELDFLLSTPFRYSARNPYPSRFRKAHAGQGVFYGAERPETAIAEIAFYRLLFFAESPATPWPVNAGEYTAFAAPFRTRRALDLTREPWRSEAKLHHLVDYSESQVLAETARQAGIEVIRYISVRDPEARANLALLTSNVFTANEPVDLTTWRIHFDAAGVRAVCEWPRLSLMFDRNTFARDPRLKGFKWDR